MKAARPFVTLAFFAFIVQSGIPQAMAQAHKATGAFDGNWTWAAYAKGKVFVPEGFNPKKVPYDMLALNLSQRGNKLTGQYINTVRFAAQIEDGDLSTIIKGNRAEIELQSGFGGKLKVLLTRRGNKLYWKVIQSEGDHNFPREVILNKDR